MALKIPLMSLDRIGELVSAAFHELVDHDGSARASDVLAGVERRVGLSDIEKSLNKSGVARWETNLRFLRSLRSTFFRHQQSKSNWKWRESTPLNSESES